MIRCIASLEPVGGDGEAQADMVVVARAERVAGARCRPWPRPARAWRRPGCRSRPRSSGRRRRRPRAAAGGRAGGRPRVDMTSSALRRQRALNAATNGSPSSQRRDAAILREHGGPGIVALGQHLPSARPGIAGCTIQPSRQPVIAQALEKPLSTNTRLVRAGQLQEGRGRVGAGEDVAVVDLVGDQARARAARHRSSRPRWPSRVITQPVGLDGLLT